MVCATLSQPTLKRHTLSLRSTCVEHAVLSELKTVNPIYFQFIFYSSFSISISSLFWELGLGFSMTGCCHKIVTKSHVIIEDG